jgi:hypothetical protein
VSGTVSCLPRPISRGVRVGSDRGGILALGFYDLARPSPVFPSGPDAAFAAPVGFVFPMTVAGPRRIHTGFPSKVRITELSAAPIPPSPPRRQAPRAGARNTSAERVFDRETPPPARIGSCSAFLARCSHAAPARPGAQAQRRSTARPSSVTPSPRTRHVALPAPERTDLYKLVSGHLEEFLPPRATSTSAAFRLRRARAPRPLARRRS